MGFEKLSQIVELKVAYTAQSSLAVHAGDPALPQMADNPVVRIGGRPAIPGSTLKGAIRSALEGLLADAGARVCVPDTAIPRSERSPADRKARYAERLGRQLPCRPDSPCPVCRLFGTASGKGGLAGTAMVLDARAAAGALTAERAHVAITRDTRSQSEGSLRDDEEVVDAGAEFVGTIRLINPEDWQVGAILAGLDTVQLLGIGAKKSAGYGELDIQVRGITLKRRVPTGWQPESASEDQYRSAFAQFVTKGAEA